jgi:hypothetical protein
MTPKGKPREKGDTMKKTTVDLPEPLWRSAKIRAMDEGADLRSVIIRALEIYLKTKPAGGAR